MLEDMSPCALSERALCWSGELNGEWSAQPEIKQATNRINRMGDLFILYSLWYELLIYRSSLNRKTYAFRGHRFQLRYSILLCCASSRWINVLFGNIGSHFILSLACLEFLPQSLVITHAGFDCGFGYFL